MATLRTVVVGVQFLFSGVELLFAVRAGKPDRIFSEKSLLELKIFNDRYLRRS